jgi:replicative DNA helicase
MHVGALSEAPIYIDDSPGLTSFELRAKVRRLKANKGCRLVIVDYLQLLAGPASESRQAEISQISRSLKGLAREMSIPILAVAQLNRQVEAREDKRPRMADLRESGSLEQDADVVMLLYRPAYYSGTDNDEDVSAQLIVAKQRNGPTGSVNLAFIKQHMRFESSTEGIPGSDERFHAR